MDNQNVTFLLILPPPMKDYGLDSLPTMEPVYGNIDAQSAVSQAASYVSTDLKKQPPPPPPTSKPQSFFMRLFGRGDPVLNDEGNERRKEAFIEDAMDREKVSGNGDLIRATGQYTINLL